MAIVVVMRALPAAAQINAGTITCMFMFDMPVAMDSTAADQRGGKDAAFTTLAGAVAASAAASSVTAKQNQQQARVCATHKCLTVHLSCLSAAAQLPKQALVVCMQEHNP